VIGAAYRMRRSAAGPRCGRISVDAGGPLCRSAPGAPRGPFGYPQAVSFSADDLALLDRSEEVRIEIRAPGGSPHSTIIWVVVDAGDAFVRSVGGKRGRCYREAVANPAVALLVDGRRLTATAIHASDPDSVERVSDALRRKYGADPALATMLRERTLATTLRLEPA